MNLVRASIVALAMSVGGCSYIPHGTYRFQSEFERDPVAFRAPSGETLPLTIKFQNLTDREIKIAGIDKNSPGLYLEARVQSASAFFGKPRVTPGYRADSFILSSSSSEHVPLFDKHGPALDDLAAAAPTLLHLNADDLRSNLGLLGNEAGFIVDIPIDWSKVPSAPQVISAQLVLSVYARYAGADGKVYDFVAPFQRRMTAYLINGRRFGNGSLPAPNGPLTGEFRTH